MEDENIFKKPEKQNQSLTMKWWWKFANEDNMLWKEVIIAKYGMEDKWMSKMISTPYKCTTHIYGQCYITEPR